jgi:hypothetical protein
MNPKVMMISGDKTAEEKKTVKKRGSKYKQGAEALRKQKYSTKTKTPIPTRLAWGNGLLAKRSEMTAFEGGPGRESGVVLPNMSFLYLSF